MNRVLVVAISTFWLGSCLISVANAASFEHAAVLIERTDCFGSCPSYEAEIYGDGRVVWKGHEYVAVKGISKSHIDPSSVAVLFTKYFSQSEREICIDESGVDSPIYYILYSQTGNLTELKSERDELYKRRQSDSTITEPCSLGKEFDAAITQFDRVANTHRWMHGRESLQDTKKVSEDVFFGTKPGFTSLMRAAWRGQPR